MTFEEFDQLQCKCGYGHTEPVPGMKNSVRCKRCGGWCGFHTAYLEEPEVMREAFKPKPHDA